MSHKILIIKIIYHVTNNIEYGKALIKTLLSINISPSFSLKPKSFSQIDLK